jgi:hypothetical protein
LRLASPPRRHPLARIGEIVGNDDLVTTARTYTHVVVNEREVDYTRLLRP